MKQKIFILVMTLLISLLLIIIIPFGLETEAGSGEGEGENNIGLDYEYIWSITWDLADVVHDDAIWGDGDNVIRKGRAFGTKGDRWVADNILIPEMDQMGLENVELLQLGPIAGRFLWEYTSKVGIVDFSLTANHPGFLFYEDGHIVIVVAAGRFLEPMQVWVMVRIIKCLVMHL